MGTRKNTSPAAETAAEERKTQAVRETTAEVQAAPEAPEIPAAFRAYEEQPCTVTAPKGLNLRQGPEQTYPVLGVLAEGTPVTALPLPYGAEVPGWVLAAADGGFGWVRREFLAAAAED